MVAKLIILNITVCLAVHCTTLKEEVQDPYRDKTVNESSKDKGNCKALSVEEVRWFGSVYN